MNSDAVIANRQEDTDWEVIEGKYRAGVLSIREIARQHGVSHTLINKHAKRASWTRDLSEKVRQATSRKLISVVSTSVSSGNAETDQHIIDEESNVQVAVVRGHRSDIQRNFRLMQQLREQLEIVASNRESFEAVIAEIERGDSGASAERQRALMRAVSLPSHIACLRDLTTVQRTLIALDREAFGIDERVVEKPDVLVQVLAMIDGKTKDLVARPAPTLSTPLPVQDIDAANSPA